MAKKRILTEVQIEWLKNNYINLGAEGCGKFLGKTKQQIKTFVKNNKLHLKISKELLKSLVGRKIGKQNNEYGINPEQFYNIQTPEVAYILGLLWADGYVYKNEEKNAFKIVLETKYEDFLEFKEILSKIGKWAFYERNRKKYSKQGRAVAFNRPLVNFLIENDYKVKSNESADKILSKIPDHLKHYWFRGLLDGDGYICKRDYKLTISSSFEQNWEYLQNLSKKLNIISKTVKKIEKTGKSSYFLLSGKKNSIPFLDYIYKDFDKDNIGLNRKYLIYQEKLNKLKRKSSKPSF